jgi:hypothetical protein
MSDYISLVLEAILMGFGRNFNEGTIYIGVGRSRRINKGWGSTKNYPQGKSCMKGHRTEPMSP